MDVNGFDTLTKSVSAASTRRGLVRLITALPLSGVVVGLLGEEDADGQGSGAGVGGGSGRRRRRGNHPGQDKNNGKSQDKRTCARAGQTPNKGKRKGCCQGLSPDGSGRCAVPGPGPTPDSCTGLKPTGSSPTQGLQEAIDGAEPEATLTLCAGTWNLTSTVELNKNLTLIGAGDGKTILDGGDAVRVLRIEANTTVTLHTLTITKGDASGEYPDSAGGGIYNFEGTLTLRGVAVTGNTAAGDGGGILNRGTLTLQTGSSVMGNISDNAGGGIYNYYDSTVTLQTGSSVTGNTTARGGGIFNLGTLTLQTGSSVADNTSAGDGGGIDNSGTVTLQTGSSVTGNIAASWGGGIFNRVGGAATLEEGSSVTANTAGLGGGIYNIGDPVTLPGDEVPSPIVVNNCQVNCAGPTEVANCAETPVSCS